MARKPTYEEWEQKVVKLKKDLIPKLKELKPKFKIITMTGHNTEELEREIRTPGIIYYMSKPFPPEELKTILDHISKKNREEVK